MSKILLEILDGGLENTVELNRESRSLIKTHMLWLKKAYPGGEEEITEEKFDFKKCGLNYLTSKFE